MYDNSTYEESTYQEAPPAADQGSPDTQRSRVSIPTVLASAGVAAVISALIMTIGVVGVVLSNTSSSNNASAQVPTVVNLGSAAQPNAAGVQQGVTQPGAAQQQAPAAAPGATQAPAAEQVGESGGTNNAGTAPAQGAQPTAVPQQTQPQQTQQQTQTQAAAPAALTPGQLNTKVRLVMNPQASRAARAAELEGGERALRQIDAVSTALAAYSNVGFSYTMINPVQVNGTTLTAPLQMTVVGRGSQNQQLTWVWSGGKWKLTNRSVCDVAGLVLLPCSL